MLESEITAKGQITLPKPVREALRVGPGDRVRYFVLDGEVRMRPVRPIQRLFGVLAHEDPPVTLDEMQRAIAEGAATDWSRSIRMARDVGIPRSPSSYPSPTRREGTRPVSGWAPANPLSLDGDLCKNRLDPAALGKTLPTSRFDRTGFRLPPE